MDRQFVSLFWNNNSGLVLIREIVIVENIRLVRLLDLTADFGVKTSAKLTTMLKLREKRKPDI